MRSCNTSVIIVNKGNDLSNERFRVYRRRGERFTDRQFLEVEVLWSGLEFVMMVALSSRLFKEH
jgi:hypothetical protein